MFSMFAKSAPPNLEQLFRAVIMVHPFVLRRTGYLLGSEDYAIHLLTRDVYQPYLFTDR